MTASDPALSQASEGRSKQFLSALFAATKTAVGKVIAPLRVGDGPNKFNLSAVETATTTYNGTVGWSNRPPAVLRCPRCESEILQHGGYDRIDCPNCVESFEYDEFGDLDLLYLGCPRCKTAMLHGQRHPERFDIPEWATCNDCRYHWEFKHSYDRPSAVERSGVR